jgi:hypothetical protein
MAIPCHGTCNMEEMKIPIINGRKFTLKDFWSVCWKNIKKGLHIARDNNTNVGNESYHISEDFVARCQSQ